VQLLERQLEDMRQERDHWRTAFEQERERAQRAIQQPQRLRQDDGGGLGAGCGRRGER
jgi:hypothetical protein